MNLTSYKALALAALWVGLIVVTGILFAFIPNVEGVTALVWTAGYLLGLKRGVMVAAVGEALFSALNPMGSGLGFPVLFLLQVFSMMGVAALGGILTRPALHLPPFLLRFALGFLGALVTLSYDLLTALSFPLAAGMAPATWGAAVLAGLPFYVIHIAANALLFALFLPALWRNIREHLEQYGLMEPSALRGMIA